MPRKSAKHERVDKLEVILSERKEASNTVALKKIESTSYTNNHR
jgi:hypothetical protein